MAVRLPISIRLTLWYGLSMVLLLGLFSGLAATSLHVNQHLLLHQRLFQAQSELRLHLRVIDGKPHLVPGLAALEGHFREGGPFGTYARLLSPEGEVLDETPNFSGQVPLEPILPSEAKMTEIPYRWQDNAIRLMYIPLWEGDKEKLVGWLETSGYALDITHHIRGVPLMLSILLTVLLALGGGYVLARRALKPVARLTDAANAITASDLSVRLPTEARVQDELTDLAETFNTMLARLEAAFQRERRFTANAAHELMNPLAAIRNEAEVGLRRPRDPATYQRALQDVLADATRLGKMLEQLLLLARIDAVSGLPQTEVDVSTLAQERLAHWQPEADTRSVNLSFTDAPEATLKAIPTHLATVLDNLLENALKYTPSGGSVHLCLAATPGHLQLTVEDTGIGFDPTLAPHLFDRFYRADTPEVQAESGSGLGLSIVRVIAEAYGGTVTATSAGPHQGSTFIVRLPR